MDEFDRFVDRQRESWDAGDFDPFARMIAPVATALVAGAAPQPGEVVVDVGCGNGTVALQAAREGARVIGIDIAPGMLDRARAAADEARLHLDLREGDARSLPVEDDAADVVLSNFGAMFAPQHLLVAGEILRVLAPGGRFAMSTWDAGGAVAEFLGLPARHSPPPPAGIESPLQWGDPHHIRAVFDQPGCADLAIVAGTYTVPFTSTEAATALYRDRFGPIVAARPALEAAGVWEAFTGDLHAFFERLRLPDGTVAMPAEHLIISGRRSG
ncbi:MAG: methyltransferase domain-containing protein [Miltoncostaeaceae bacterium]